MKLNRLNIITCVMSFLSRNIKFMHILKMYFLKIKIKNLQNHCQMTGNSCIPMSVECVLKLLRLMPIYDFSLQNDPSKSGNSNWVPGFSYPGNNPQIIFSREFLLSDKGLPDRGQHFMTDYFDSLFNTIDEELKRGRFVIISLQSAPTATQWHMEVIFNKVNDNEYETVTFYHNHNGPVVYNSQNLKQRVT